MSIPLADSVVTYQSIAYFRELSEGSHVDQAPDREVLKQLIDTLRKRDYLFTARFPALRRPLWMFALEPHVFLRYVQGRTSSFTPTALPALYGNKWFRSHKDTEILYRLFYLNRNAEIDSLDRILGSEMLSGLVDSGMIKYSNGIVRSEYRLVPRGDSIFLSDPDQGNRRTTVQYVYVGNDSVVLADFAHRTMLNREYERGLDLCAGTAFQGYNIRSNCRSVLAAEFNPRAVDFARATFYANGINDSFSIVQSDLWEKVTGTFDIIVSNPPYYPASECLINSKILDVFGGTDHGMEKPLIIFDGFGQYLDKGGLGMLLAASPVIMGEDILMERLKPLAERHGLETVLIPWKFTNIKLDPEYQVQHGIDYLIHYIIHTRKTGNGSVILAGYPYLVKFLEKLQIGIQKRLSSWPGS